MTNEEAIVDLQFLARRFEDLDQLTYSINRESLDLSILALEEIDKLKDEVEQLKSELEQSVRLQNVLSKLLKGSEFARCYMCDNSMKNITLDGKNNGCDGSCYYEKNYTENDLIEKIKCELDRIERRK